MYKDRRLHGSMIPSVSARCPLLVGGGFRVEESPLLHSEEVWWGEKQRGLSDTPQ